LSRVRRERDGSYRHERTKPRPRVRGTVGRTAETMDEPKVRPIITVQQHMPQEQRRFPGASGAFSWLLSGIPGHQDDPGQVRQAEADRTSAGPRVPSPSKASPQSSTSTPTRFLLHCLSVRQSIDPRSEAENESSIRSRTTIPRPPTRSSSTPRRFVRHRRERERRTTCSILRPGRRRRLGGGTRWVLQPGSKQVAAARVTGRSPTLVLPRRNWRHGFTLRIRPSARTSSVPRHPGCRHGKYTRSTRANARLSPGLSHHLRPPASGHPGASLRAALIGRGRRTSTDVLKGESSSLPESTTTRGQAPPASPWPTEAFIGRAGRRPRTDGPAGPRTSPRNRPQRTPLIVAAGRDGRALAVLPDDLTPLPDRLSPAQAANGRRPLTRKGRSAELGAAPCPSSIG